MVLNKTGGNKAKKQSSHVKKSPEIDTLEPEQLFGLIKENKGSHFNVLCNDGKIRRGRACNKVKNARDKRLIRNETFVVVSLRLFEKDDSNCDIIGFANPTVAKQYSIFKLKDDEKEEGEIVFSDEIIKIDKVDKKDKVTHIEENFKTNIEFDISDI